MLTPMTDVEQMIAKLMVVRRTNDREDAAPYKRRPESGSSVEGSSARCSAATVSSSTLAVIVEAEPVRVYSHSL
ncbi:unnamed protein product [Gongylonema pulchrum]|uniref:Transposase n=1 Tax=Gongylonema pulchrum TaxID=637853 RepID=A0A183EE32_9BILA|nr:unnamed protein product [Gongylonema pulchrum]